MQETLTSSEIATCVNDWRQRISHTVGGFDSAIDSILSLLSKLIHSPANGTARRASRGVLLSGPPGSGKSHLASTLASVVSGTSGTFELNLSFVLSNSDGASTLKTTLAAVTTSARSRQSVSAVPIFVLEGAEVLLQRLDDDSNFDFKSGNQASDGPPLDMCAFSLDVLLCEMQLWSRDDLPALVIVPWSSSYEPPAELCSVGAIQARVSIPVPLGRKQRRAALVACSRNLPLDDSGSEDLLDRLADMTAGFLPCDLSALCRTAALLGIHRSSISGQKVKLSLEDFCKARLRLDPTPIRGAGAAARSRSKTSSLALLGGDHGLSAVVGQHLALETLRAYVVEPFRKLQVEDPHLGWQNETAEPPVGILLTGGPGSGKSFIAVQLAAELNAQLFAASPADLLASRVGDAEKRVATLFRAARRAAPSVVVIEDIDSIAPAGMDEEAEFDSEEGSETCAAFVLRVELDALRSRRVDHARLRSGLEHSPEASEALVLVVATASDASRVAHWLRVPHRFALDVDRMHPKFGFTYALMKLTSVLRSSM